LKSGIDIKAALASRTLREFDIHFTSKLFGYKTVDDYYHDASSLPYVKHVSISTLFVNAKDDPFIDPIVYEDPVFESNENVVLALTESGGHIGFLSGWNPFHTRATWIDNVVSEYISTVLQLEAL
jgi:predicted alpha/beta-fold hydrolase